MERAAAGWIGAAVANDDGKGLQSSTGPAPGLGAGQLGVGPARLEVVRDGARMEVRVDDTLADVIVDPELAGATGAGLITAGDQTRPRWDDFEAVPAS